jgi:hypothetical protein
MCLIIAECWINASCFLKIFHWSDQRPGCCKIVKKTRKGANANDSQQPGLLASLKKIRFRHWYRVLVDNAPQAFLERLNAVYYV